MNTSILRGILKSAELMGQGLAGLSSYSDSVDQPGDLSEAPSFHSYTKRYDPNSTMSKFHKNRDLQQYAPSGKDSDTIKTVTDRDSRLSDIQDRRLLDSQLRNR